MHRMLVKASALLAVVLLASGTYVSMNFISTDTNIEIKKNGSLLQKRGQKFSGWIFSFYSRFNIRSISRYQNGLKDGREIFYYENGQKWSEQFFQAGLPHGQSRGWFKNGSPRFTKEYLLGMNVGEYWAWHDNGQLAYFVKYNSGQEIAYKSWTAFGKPFYNYVWQGQQKTGLKGGAFCKLKPI